MNLIKRLRNYMPDGPDGSVHTEAAERIAELEARLADAHDLVDAYSACVDGYYIPSGKSVISEHDEYVQKWGDWE